MMDKISRLSLKMILIMTLWLVFTGWLIQLAFHQVWLCAYSGHIPWKFGFYLFILLSTPPLLYSLFLLRSSTQICTLNVDYRDGFLAVLLILVGLIFWWLFSAEASSYPVHTYGDESFHNGRVHLMVSDLYTWYRHLFTRHMPPPAYRAEYMMYPALAYVPVSLWGVIFGNADSITQQRVFLVVSYLGVILATYLLSRIIIKSRPISLLVAMMPASSALLLSYTMSFYIELHYVGVLLFSFCLLAFGIEKKSKTVVMTAVFVASLAPIIRESALAGTIGIVFSVILWCYLDRDCTCKVKRYFSMCCYALAGLFPFFMYYIAKSHYTDWDRSRTSLNFVLHQDYWALLSYLFIYIGPLAALALLLFVAKPMHAKKHFYVILAAAIGIVLGVALQSIFITGYMPWTRNYLFYYAQFTVLIVLFLDVLYRQSTQSKSVVWGLVIFSLVTNLMVLICYLPNDKIFHESEVVFEFKPISKYIEQHREVFDGKSIHIYWPKDFPTYPDKLLPKFVKLNKIDSLVPVPWFLSFDDIEVGIPHVAQYILFFYLRNESKPRAFHDITAVESPKFNLKYHVLVNSIDPWSQGRNGVMLLEKSRFP